MKVPLKLFIKFLKKERCFQAYITACNIDKKNYITEDVTILEYLFRRGIIDEDKKCDENSLMNSFDWEEFEYVDGEDYEWEWISKKWRHFLKK